ncbi:nuclear transport factor 2 family protein [Nocardia flavorosea]|uniref:nuclear transport factor 2 family protein n=1 Tax=Nocardia flavorosea TaxID=53429 RepID=UPI001893ABE1|nr:nuclear transport factor 2 family protein [Nocardia flavorosea]MBF6347598.1 nuclear transport factor 2 family protein [Nocardia flavorosea]
MATFTAGWADVDSRALDPLMAEDIELVQPVIPTCHGKRQWWEAVDRLQSFATDLHSDVLGWSGSSDRLYIEHRLGATIGGRAVRIDAVDNLELDRNGQITRRTAYFDPTPLVVAVLSAPSVWPRWWRSGVRPRLRELAGSTGHRR